MVRKSGLLVISFALVTCSTSLTHAQQDPLATQHSSSTPAEKSQCDAKGPITRDQADAILQELKSIHKFLEKQSDDSIAEELRLIRQVMERQQFATTPAAVPGYPSTPSPLPNARLSIAGLPVLGKPDAPLTLVEFADYQCPYCKAFHTSVFEHLRKDWIDTGKLRFVSYDFPLDIHPSAERAALAAWCAGEQTDYWPMRNLLLANSDAFELDAILANARQVPQLDMDQFSACMKAEKYSMDIKDRAGLAISRGISGTPTFLIARSSGDVADGVLMVGTQPYSALQDLMEAVLGAKPFSSSK
jgi:protein-disulfide isomerase